MNLLYMHRQNYVAEFVSTSVLADRRRPVSEDLHAAGTCCAPDFKVLILSVVI
jgi:hypothetical protein